MTYSFSQFNFFITAISISTAFFLYNVIFYLVLRKSIYLWYAFLILALTLHISNYPILLQYSAESYRKLSVITAFLSSIAYLKFTYEFFRLNDLDLKKWKKILLFLITTGCIGLLAQLGHLLTNYNHNFNLLTSLIAAIHVLASLVTTLVLSVTTFNKFRTSRIFIYSITPLILGSLIYTITWLYLRFYSNANSLIETDYVVQIYVALVIIQLILFSFAVSSEQKQLETKRWEIQKDINKQLKKEVDEQTQYLLEANYKIEKQNHDLHEINLTKNKLFSLVAHDLRSSLVNLYNLVTVVQMKKGDTVNFERLIDNTKKSVGNSLKVADQVLEWSQSQLEGLTLDKKWFSFQDVTEETLRFLDPLLSEKHLEINVNIEQQHCFGDQQMVSTMMRNLISNSIKYSHNDTTIYINAFSTDKAFIFSVKDQGIGMEDTSWFDTVSLENQRSRAEGTYGERGTGFGLVTIKDFVQLHEGDITCESKPEQGTTFTVTLPLG